MTLHPREIELRQSTYQWLRGRFLNDGAAVASANVRRTARLNAQPVVQAAVTSLASSGDLGALIERLGQLTTDDDSGSLDLAGPKAITLLTLLETNTADPASTASVLAVALELPDTATAAAEAISSVIAHMGTLSSVPSTGRVPSMLANLWNLQSPDSWPRWSPAVVESLTRLGWSAPEQSAGYLELIELVSALGSVGEVLDVLHWWGSATWAPDPTIVQRTAWASQLFEAQTDGEPHAFTNANAMLSPLRPLGDELEKRLGDALDRRVTRKMPPVVRNKGQARYDAYVSWMPVTKDDGFTQTPSFRVAFGHEGLMVGVHLGRREPGWVKKAAAEVAQLPLGTLQILTGKELLPPSAPSSNWGGQLVGRITPYSELDWNSIPDLAIDIARQCHVVLQKVLADGPSWSEGLGTATVPLTTNDELKAQYHEFVAETGYPTAADLAQTSDRQEMAASLEPHRLFTLDPKRFRLILNTNRYGYAGNRSVLNRTLANPDEEALQLHIFEVLSDLLYGQDPVEVRLERDPKRLPGLGLAGANKLLAIVHPDRFLPIFPLVGPMGKMSMLNVLGLPLPDGTTMAAKSVAANDAIRSHLVAAVPELSEDPWGIAMFTYWLANLGTEEPAGETDRESQLEVASETCLLPPGSRFLHELVDLLEDKGQIVLYGPPGTGKTFVARELAKALAPADRQMLVQFHPSTAYEDFMEGFRPVLRDGELTYELTQGPLIQLADAASADLDHKYILIIDEMNRANLPKVFGELLFLLEYRNEPTRLAYRADGEPFVLPDNLWVIGTMNLADRSVGQIDAALRRRFAFVSFSPNDDQTGGLLGRWLAKDNQNPWPADLVDAVNVELELDLGHTDLLIGPSYFMKKKLDMEKMGRIWRYSIEPVTADLFHGDNNLTKKYRWSSVAARHKAIVPTTQSDSSATAAVVALSNEQAPASAATSTTPSANAADDIAN